MLRQDILYGARMLVKNGRFTLVTVVTLALGIGATSAIFSFVDHILFRNLPYPQDDQLVSVGVIAPVIDGEFLFSSNYLQWRQQRLPFTGFTSEGGVRDCDLTESHPVRLKCATVTSTFLPTFGIVLSLGRNFSPDEDNPQAPKVALISYGLWRSRFSQNRAILGQTVSVDGNATRVLGVLPRTFEFPTLAHVDVLVPEALDQSVLQRAVTGPVVRVFGRLKPGISIQQARDQLQPLFRTFVESAPPEFRSTLRLQVRPVRDLQIHNFRLAAWVLLLAAVSVLLIACANVASLVFGQGLGRQHEMAVRCILGATRARLLRQTITESLLLVLIGSVAGCALAYALIRGLVAFAPAEIPRLSAARLDGRVLLFTLLTSLLAGVLFGIIPALQRPVMEALTSVTSVGRRRNRFREAVICFQVSVTFVLLAGALLFLHSLINLQNRPLGMNTENVIAGELTLGQQQHSEAAQELTFYEALEQKLKETPGVTKVALSDSLPPGVPARTVPFDDLEVEGRSPLSPQEGIGGVVGWRSITPEYFSLLGIPLVHGHFFGEADRQPSSRAIILNQILARRLFRNEDPVGRAIRFRDEQHSSEPFTVTGIVGNTQNQGLAGNVGPEYYLVRRHTVDDQILHYPDSQRVRIIIRTAVDAGTMEKELRDVIASLDPTVPVDTSTLTQSIARLAVRPRFSAALISVFAVLATLLTALGVYGLCSLFVSQRQQEIGIRMALGAERGSVVRLILLETSIWIAVGCGAGVLGSLLIAHGIRTQLFGIAESDPATFVEATMLLLVTAALGAWVPARRASKVQPMVALRYE
jgi:putative ABC transport system permease protein